MRPPTEDIDTWLKFASLCWKNNRISQARSTLVTLLQVSSCAVGGNDQSFWKKILVILVILIIKILQKASRTYWTRNQGLLVHQNKRWELFSSCFVIFSCYNWIQLIHFILTYVLLKTYAVNPPYVVSNNHILFQYKIRWVSNTQNMFLARACEYYQEESTIFSNI